MAGKLGKKAGGAKRGRRPRNKQGGAEPTQPIPSVAKPLGNITDETMQELGAEYVEARKELDKIMADARSQRAVISGIKKRSKKLGLNPEYLSRHYELRDRDPTDVQRETAEFNRYLVAMRYPVGYQLGLFADGETVAGKIDKADKGGTGANADAKAAWQAGYDAGINGKPIASNPYPEESEPWNQFEEGWGKAQAERANQTFNPSAAKH